MYFKIKPRLLRQRSRMFCGASSPPDLNPFEHVFHLLKAKLSKQELKTALKKKKRKA